MGPYWPISPKEVISFQNWVSYLLAGVSTRNTIVLLQVTCNYLILKNFQKNHIKMYYHNRTFLKYIHISFIQIFES